MSNVFSQFKIQDIFDRDPEKFEPHPRRVWALIFVSAVVLIALILSAHSYFYFYVRSDESFKPEENVATVDRVKLNRKGLTDVVTLFEKKNTLFQELLVTPPTIPDPSSSVNSQIAPEGAHKISAPSADTTPPAIAE